MSVLFFGEVLGFDLLCCVSVLVYDCSSFEGCFFLGVCCFCIWSVCFFVCLVGVGG